MHYNQNNFKYPCLVCGTFDMSSVKNIGHTEVQYWDITDDKGNTHSHDHNDGQVRLICKDGHETTLEYIPSCECGWSEIYQAQYSCETFEKTKPVGSLFGDEDDW